ncbi:MAG: gliding motility-associated C-terminal domain-containing protein [Bacteroidota bacterium]
MSTVSLSATAANAVSPYRVSVTVDGCTSPISAGVAVQVDSLPAAIATNGGNICLGEAAQLFANTIPGAVYEWRISGSPAIISTAQNPTINGQLTDVTYELTVIVNGCISNPVALTTIAINDAPTATPNYTYTLNADCSPADLSLSANATAGDGAITTYAWSGPNNFQSTQANPTIIGATPANNGSYSLTVTDANGCSVSQTVEVSGISDSPALPVIASSGPSCEGEQIILSIPSYSGSSVSYTWTTPGGTTDSISGLNTNQIVISPVDASIHEGDYSVTVVIDGCTLASAAYNVEVFATPTAAPTATIGIICEGGSLSLLANATDATSYEWDGPQGFRSTAVNPQITDVTTDNNGTYTLTVRSINGCSTTSSVLVDNIMETPVTPVLTSNGPLCITETIELFVQQTYTGTAVTYSWTNGAGQVIGANRDLSIPANSSIAIPPYRLAVTVDGCSSELSEPMDVLVKELPVAIASNGGAVCPGEDGLLIANALPNATYEWRVAGSANIISTERVVNIPDLTSTTTFELTVIVEGCVSDPINTTTIVVNDPPTVFPGANYVIGTDCAPSALELDANAFNGSGTIVAYDWRGPNGFTSAVVNPVIPNATSVNNGSYTLVVTDENGCTASGSVEVRTVVDPVNLPIISSSGPSCEGGSVQLSVDLYTGSNVTYTWSTPAGTTVNISGLNSNAITISPVNAALHEGSYSVTIDVDGCVLTAADFELQLLDGPTAVPSATVTNICEGGTLELSANATGVAPLTYSWSGPAGFTSDLANPIINDVTANNNGTYTLQITNSSGCIVTESLTVNNIQTALDQPTITASTSICEGEPLVLTTSSSAATYEWIGPLGSSATTLLLPGLTTTVPTTTLVAGNPAYLAGEWQVHITDANGCVSISDPIMVEIHPIPTAQAFNDGPICAGDQVQLSADEIDGARYEWRIAGSGALISTEREPLISNLMATTIYELTVIVNGCVSDPLATTTVTVNQSATLDPQASYTLSPDCTPTDLMLEANILTSDAPIVDYSWIGPNGFTSAVADPVIPNATTANNGSYTLQVTDANGCTASASVAVTTIVDAVAVPVISSSGPSCDGDEIVLTIPMYSGSNVDYIWTTPNATTINITGLNSHQITISPVDPGIHEGTYSVRVEVDDCILESDTYELDVFTSPQLAPTATAGPICEGEQLVLTANAVGANQYLWTGPNGFLSVAANPTIPNVSIANNGTYSLQVTSSSGCIATASIVVGNIVPSPVQPTITAEDLVCEDGTIVLSVPQAYFGSSLNFNWTNGSGQSIGNGQTITLAANSVLAVSPYRVQVTVDGCASPVSEPVNVEVKDLPIASASNNGAICRGEDVQLFAGTIDGAAYEWRIAGSPTIISTDQNPIIYGLNGTTIYELTVISDGCLSDPLAQTTVTVNDLPTVTPSQNYTLNPDCAPSDLSLSGGVVPGSGQIVSYQWSGPNGFTAFVENPLIPNANSTNNGSYELVVTDVNGCTASGVVEVSGISDQIPQPVIASTGPACNGDQIILTVPVYSGASVDYSWTVPSTTNITGLNTNQIVISPLNEALHVGAYEVEIVVDDCTIRSDVYELEVFEQASANPTATTTVICEGGILRLEANAVNAATYQWSGPNGFSSSAINPQIANVAVAANGTYTLLVTSVSGCESTHSIVVDNIVPSPPQASILTRDRVCANEVIELRIQQFYNGSTIAYKWYNGVGDLIGTTRDLDIAATDAAAVSPYYVIVEVDGCEAPSSELASVEVIELPVATARNSGPACMGASVTLEAGSIAGASYAWYEDDPDASSPPIPPFSTERVLEVSPPAPGFYTYYLRVETAEGCLSDPMATSTVEILQAPVISNLSGGGTYCEGENVFLAGINTIPVNGPVSYTWRGPNGFVFAATAGVTGSYPLTLLDVDAQMSGPYRLQLESVDGCQSEVETIQVNVRTRPQTAQLSVNSDFICEGNRLELSAATASGGTQVSYEWFLDDGNGSISIGTTDIPNFFINNVDGSDAGVYTVAVTIDGCTASPSNGVNVAVFSTVNPPVTSNNTTQADPACEGNTVELNVPIIVGATYEWFGPNGFSSTQPNPVITNVRLEDVGSYYVVIDLNGCATVISETTIVYVQPQLEVPTIVNNGPVCEGGEITLSVSSPISVPNGVDLSFEWYKAFTNELVATTVEPELLLSNLTAADGGEYYLVMVAGNCRAPLSNRTLLVVDEIPPNEADAGIDLAVCATTVVNLDAEPPSVGSGQWASLTGATVSNPDLPNSEVIDLQEGDNIFVWSLSNGACTDYDADTVVITVTLVPGDEAFAGNDIDICGRSTTTLNANPPLTAEGVWTQSLAQASLGVVIAEPNNPNTEITGLAVGQSYEFSWTLSEGVCPDFATDIVVVTVNEAPSIQAFITEPLLYVCNDQTAVLKAETPSIGTGEWLTASGARIIEPFSSTTFVDDLDMGENVFVWSLSNGTCKDFSSDTLLVIREELPLANTESYFIPFRDSLIGEELLSNDQIDNISDLSIQLIQGPENGLLSDRIEDGIMDYVPDAGFFGQDVFIYQLCNANCPTTCDTAIIYITVMENTTTVEDCWVPNVLTPNSDRMNDALTIPCLVNYPGNKIKVFNRWGDKVYEAGPYLNDWEGTYRGETLPPGTYFYILQLEPDKRPIQGFFTLNR